jgi:hypothetical protein
MTPEARREFVCLFCGESGLADRVTLSASWDGADGLREQSWWAHRGCLLDRMAARVRSAGGPVVEDDFA